MNKNNAGNKGLDSPNVGGGLGELITQIWVTEPGTSWNSVELRGTRVELAWNSVELRGTRVAPRGIPWNSRGTPWNSVVLRGTRVEPSGNTAARPA